MTRVNECILYRNFEHGEVLEQMTELMDLESKEELGFCKKEFFSCVNQLIELAGAYGFSGNLWHNYLTFLLVNHENAFSTSSEIVGPDEELSIRSRFMISRSLKSCSTIIFQCLTRHLEESIASFCPAMKISTRTANCLIKNSGPNL